MSARPDSLSNPRFLLGSSLAQELYDYALSLEQRERELWEALRYTDAALEELLNVAERIRGGDTTLNPEEWYVARDTAKVGISRARAALGKK